MPDRQRLAHALRKRRAELRLTQTAIADRAGVSLATVNQMEREQRDDFRTVTKALIEEVLRWTPGSIDSLLAGGDATPMPNGQSAAVTPVRVGVSDLPQELVNAVDAMPQPTRELFLRLAMRIADELSAPLTGSRTATGSNTPVAVSTDNGVSQVVALDEIEVPLEQVEASAAALRERLRDLRRQQQAGNQ